MDWYAFSCFFVLNVISSQPGRQPPHLASRRTQNDGKRTECLCSKCKLVEEGFRCPEGMLMFGRRFGEATAETYRWGARAVDEFTGGS
jgi:hypothetical protein